MGYIGGNIVIEVRVLVGREVGRGVCMITGREARALDKKVGRVIGKDAGYISRMIGR